jgi:chaperonin cofactor prefoldin
MEAGDARKWYPARDKILAALPLLADTIKMSFWEAVPVDELQLALDEIEELHEAATDALRVGRERLEHEKYKAKLTKMKATNGRTDAEVEVIQRKAKTLRRKLIQS